MAHHPITDAHGKHKSGSRASRDAAFFIGGMFVGSGLTVGAGFLFDKVQGLPGAPAAGASTAAKPAGAK